MIGLIVTPFLSAEAQETEQLNNFIDDWHKAAATANEDVFFGSMSDSCIYIGTDASERWTRDELKEWSMKYFQRESAWSFTPKDRKIIFSDDGKIAWFSELLETWMGICRGSGVIQQNADGKWLLEQYHLGVTVNNDYIKEFIDLIKKDPINAYMKE